MFEQRLRTKVDAVQVGLKDLWVFVGEVDRLCDVGEPLWLSYSAEEPRPLSEDIGMDCEALCGRWRFADEDVESCLEVISDGG